MENTEKEIIYNKKKKSKKSEKERKRRKETGSKMKPSGKFTPRYSKEMLSQMKSYQSYVIPGTNPGCRAKALGGFSD